MNHDNLIFRHRGRKAGGETIEVLGRDELVDGVGGALGVGMGGVGL